MRNESRDAPISPALEATNRMMAARSPTQPPITLLPRGNFDIIPAMGLLR